MIITSIISCILILWLKRPCFSSNFVIVHFIFPALSKEVLKVSSRTSECNTSSRLVTDRVMSVQIHAAVLPDTDTGFGCRMVSVVCPATVQKTHSETAVMIHRAQATCNQCIVNVIKLSNFVKHCRIMAL